MITLEKFFYNLLTEGKYELKNRYAHIDYVQEKNQNEVKASNQTLEEQAIINILKENSRIIQEKIATKINKSVRTVKSYMSEMQNKDLIGRKNSKKNGGWIVND